MAFADNGTNIFLCVMQLNQSPFWQEINPAKPDYFPRHARFKATVMICASVKSVSKLLHSYLIEALAIHFLLIQVYRLAPPLSSSKPAKSG